MDDFLGDIGEGGGGMGEGVVLQPVRAYPSSSGPQVDDFEGNGEGEEKEGGGLQNEWVLLDQSLEGLRGGRKRRSSLVTIEDEEFSGFFFFFQFNSLVFSLSFLWFVIVFQGIKKCNEIVGVMERRAGRSFRELFEVRKEEGKDKENERKKKHFRR